MKWNIDERCVEIARFINETGATVRSAAKKYGISKSTVHKDVTARLSRVDKALYEKTKLILQKNKDERHLRGGEATRAKYKDNVEKA